MPTKPANANKKILVIEDEKLLLTLVKEELEAAGFSVIASPTGEDGLARLKETNDIGLILLDLLLPKIDGFGVLEEIKADKELKKIPVIVLSNIGEEGSIKRAIETGASDYLIKANMTPEKVTAMVRKIMNQ